MTAEDKGALQIAIGEYSDKGVKNVNQDFHGCLIPDQPQTALKGVAAVMADGISSSNVSQVASETAVKSFLHDYFCTAEIWSVKKSVHSVLAAINSWLYAQTRNSEFRYNLDRGYVCTIAVLVLKGHQAHIFHAGDTRVYRLQGNTLEPLTQDHRLVISEDTSYLSRAMGIGERLDLDYQTVAIKEGDIFILSTDGVHEFVTSSATITTIEQYESLSEAAEALVNQALENGSQDNLSIQILRVDKLLLEPTVNFHKQSVDLPLPEVFDAGSLFDDYHIVRKLHGNSRSHVYLAEGQDTNDKVVLKIPSQDQREDSAYLERLLMEEWVARRLNNPHLMKAGAEYKARQYLYTVMGYIEGQTLSQWIKDNPDPSLETVRTIIEQAARGLQALHRMEILHQDLRPENIMIDAAGTVKIIDFGAVRVAGVVETRPDLERTIPGTALYTAPEYFVGEHPAVGSDIYSLGVITFYMLSGRFPYGNNVAKCRTRSAQRKLVYQSLLDDRKAIPVWLDETLKKAVHPYPLKRYSELSEFVFDLRNPGKAFLEKTRPPLAERSPVRFWQIISALLGLVILMLLAH